MLLVHESLHSIKLDFPIYKKYIQANGQKLKLLVCRLISNPVLFYTQLRQIKIKFDEKWGIFFYL